MDIVREKKSTSTSILKTIIFIRRVVPTVRKEGR